MTPALLRRWAGYHSSQLFKNLYIRRDEYSVTDMTLPKSGRYSLTSKLALNVLGHILWRKNFADEGVIYVDGAKSCTIEYYEIDIKKGRYDWNRTKYCFYELIGKTDSGQILSDDECRRIMSLPCQKFTETGKRMTWQERLSYKYSEGEFQSLIDTDKYRNTVVKGAELLEKEILWRIRRDEHNKKSAIDKKLAELEREKQAIQKQEAQVSNVRDRTKLGKKLAVIEDDLRQAESVLSWKKCVPSTTPNRKSRNFWKIKRSVWKSSGFSN